MQYVVIISLSLKKKKEKEKENDNATLTFIQKVISAVILNLGFKASN